MCNRFRRRIYVCPPTPVQCYSPSATTTRVPNPGHRLTQNELEQLRLRNLSNVRGWNQSSFSREVSDTIRQNLGWNHHRRGNAESISLQEFTTANGIQRQMQGIATYSSCSGGICAEFNRVVSFSLPVGSNVVEFNTFRYGRDGGGNYTGRIRDQFTRPETLSCRMHNLYEVHVRQENGVDHYTVALTHQFVGGLRVTVNGESHFIVSHEQQLPLEQAPEISSARSPSITPPSSPDVVPLPQPAALPVPDQGNVERPTPSLADSGTAGTGTNPGSMPSDQNGLGSNPTPSVNGGTTLAALSNPPPRPLPLPDTTPPPLPPLPLPESSPNPRPSLSVASSDFASSGTLPGSENNESEQRTISGSPPPQALAQVGGPSILGPLSLPLPPSSDFGTRSGAGGIQLVPPALSNEMARSENDSGSSDNGPIAPQLPIGGSAPPASTVAPAYTAPAFLLGAYLPIERREPPLLFAQAQRRALLGFFASQSMIHNFFREHNASDTVAQPQLDAERDMSVNFVDHAYYPSELAFSGVIQLGSPRRPELHASERQRLTAFRGHLLLALNGNPEAIHNAQRLPPQTRAQRVEHFLTTVIGRALPPADAERLQGFVRRNRGLVPYLEEALRYVDQQLATLPPEPSRPESAQPIVTPPRVGYHAQTEALQGALRILFGEHIGGPAWREAASTIATLSTERPELFTVQDIAAMRQLLQTARETRQSSAFTSRFGSSRIDTVRTQVLQFLQPQNGGQVIDIQGLNALFSREVGERNAGTQATARNLLLLSVTVNNTEENRLAVANQMLQPFIDTLNPGDDQLRQLDRLLEQTEGYINRLRSSRQVHAHQRDLTDDASAEFLGILPHHIEGARQNFARLFPGVDLEKNYNPVNHPREMAQLLRAALTAIDCELGLLENIGGQYAAMRAQTLEVRRNDIRQYIQRNHPELFRSDAALMRLISGRQITEIPRLPPDEFAILDAVTSFGTSMRDSLREVLDREGVHQIANSFLEQIQRRFRP